MPYASPTEAVNARLIADAGVGALVADRVYPSKPTQDATWPYVVSWKQGGGDGVNLDRGRNTIQSYLVRVEAYAVTSASAEAIMAAVVTALAGWQDKTNYVWGVFPTGDADEQVSDDGTQISGQSFNVFFRG